MSFKLYHIDSLFPTPSPSPFPSPSPSPSPSLHHHSPFHSPWVGRDQLSTPSTIQILFLSLFFPLSHSSPLAIRRCISEPLRTQISIVDSAIVDYYKEDLDILSHLTALRQFLLMEDGEFSQRLSDQLFERIAASKLGE